MRASESQCKKADLLGFWPFAAQRRSLSVARKPEQARRTQRIERAHVRRDSFPNRRAGDQAGSYAHDHLPALRPASAAASRGEAAQVAVALVVQAAA